MAVSGHQNNGKIINSKRLGSTEAGVGKPMGAGDPISAHAEAISLRELDVGRLVRSYAIQQSIAMVKNRRLLAL